MYASRSLQDLKKVDCTLGMTPIDPEQLFVYLIGINFSFITEFIVDASRSLRALKQVDFPSLKSRNDLKIKFLSIYILHVINFSSITELIVYAAARSLSALKQI